jgi:hypothetical protein
LPRKGFVFDVRTKALCCKALTVLEDGTYDAIVVDTEVRDDGAVVVSLAIAAGSHRGEMVDLRAEQMRGDPVDLLGVPATITVEGGVPRVRFEP